MRIVTRHLRNLLKNKMKFFKKTYSFHCKYDQYQYFFNILRHSQARYYFSQRIQNVSILLHPMFRENREQNNNIMRKEEVEKCSDIEDTQLVGPRNIGFNQIVFRRRALPTLSWHLTNIQNCSHTHITISNDQSNHTDFLIVYQ